jgi:hypothetical protein
MPLDDRDTGWLTFAALRIRQETRGAGPWDEHGTASIIGRLKGRNLLITIEHVIRHAADPKAKTPGVLLGAYTPPAPVAETTIRRGLRRDEQCERCGGRKGDCGCTREHLAADYTDELPEHPRNPNIDAKLAKITGRNGGA